MKGEVVLSFKQSSTSLLEQDMASLDYPGQVRPARTASAVLKPGHLSTNLTINHTASEQPVSNEAPQARTSSGRQVEGDGGVKGEPGRAS
jgi:hypothetical protein